MKHASKQTARSGRVRSQRQLRVGEVLRHVLVSVLENDSIRDPDLADVSVTVTEVRVSPDLRNATAFVVPLGGGDTEIIVAALRRATPYLRRLLAGQLEFRRVPALSFEPDNSFDEAEKIETLLGGASSADRTDGDGP